MGSLPTGFLAGRWRGIDLRRVGSGNIGATNAFRILGKVTGTVVLLVDFFKGMLACLLLPRLMRDLGWADAGMDFVTMHTLLQITGGIASILGHNYSCWLGFRGGKGVATSGGVVAALLPVALTIVLGIWLLMFLLFRYVSLASITAALCLPMAVWYLERSPLLLGVAVFMGAMVVYKHRSNIQRLIHGTEHRMGKPESKTDDTPLTQ